MRIGKKFLERTEQRKEMHMTPQQRCKTYLTKDVMLQMANAMKSLKEVDPMVMNVFEALQKVPELDVDQRVDVATRIVTSQTLVALFFSMDDEGTKSFVKKILSIPE